MPARYRRDGVDIFRRLSTASKPSVTRASKELRNEVPGFQPDAHMRVIEVHAKLTYRLGAAAVHEILYPFPKTSNHPLVLQVQGIHASRNPKNTRTNVYLELGGGDEEVYYQEQHLFKQRISDRRPGTQPLSRKPYMAVGFSEDPIEDESPITSSFSNLLGVELQFERLTTWPEIPLKLPAPLPRPDNVAVSKHRPGTIPNHFLNSLWSDQGNN